ncbi:MAG TPA: tRNA (uridine(34)/cytosine(34)/5-carboxymethylaminomethyluridine(34)-2'-O)-methyltransferase TrmL [Gammaproteobacteria bacterium]|nr:tRNA (uridine(34)/cytosine(34)/5-carboxymethylaminomethyluridine(34)-2'-O)-methyltransferase TrmL [Gammaproteobacteria bacterium]
MFNVVLYQPEIPPNTGNIIRLCANSGAALHLVHPLGFTLEERQLRRAGLDYHEYANVAEHADFAACRAALPDSRFFALSTRGRRRYTEVDFQPGDAFLFGPETRGLPQALLDELGPDQVLRVPMQPNNRSLNLSNSVAVLVYEAWRQQGFAGGS